MNAKVVLICIALAAGFAAGCDRGKQADAQQAATVVNTQPPPNAPAKTTETGKTPPIQGQVDTREPAQRRDFETKK